MVAEGWVGVVTLSELGGSAAELGAVFASRQGAAHSRAGGCLSKRRSALCAA